MPLTLLEQAKLVDDPLAKGVIETFARTSPILERISFMDISGGAYLYNREETLPTVSFRGVNEDYEESTGTLDRQVEVLAVLGGCSDVDKALVKTQGNLNDVRAIHDGLLAKSISLYWTKNFIKGDTISDKKGFDGLQARCTGAQILDCGTGASGSTLTIAKIDELIDMVDGDNKALICNKVMRRKISDLARAVNCATEPISDNFGRQLLAHAGVPILVVGEDETGTEILDFNEACYTGSSVGTSIYCVDFSVGSGVFGIEASTMEIIDHGYVSGTMRMRTTIEWLTNFVLGRVKSAARLRYISNS